jgi:hypothetical protein
MPCAAPPRAGLHHPGLQRLRGDAGREAVRLDRVTNSGQVSLRVARGFEKAQGVLGREPRSLRAVGGILGDVHAVVQPGGRQYDLDARALLAGEPQRRRNHAFDVRRAVTRIGARLRRDEFPEVRLPGVPQPVDGSVGTRAHRRPRRPASATPIASRAQRASCSESSSASAGTCQ